MRLWNLWDLFLLWNKLRIPKPHGYRKTTLDVSLHGKLPLYGYCEAIFYFLFPFAP
jgi:hypothetical protein